MSIFSKNKQKKRILNAAIVDLRNYTAAALDNIGLINAATVLIPINPSPDVIESYSNIKVKNIANELSVDKDALISEISGITIIDENNYDPNIIYSTSGTVFIKKFDMDTPVRLITSGITLYEKGAKLQFIAISGIAYELGFVVEHTKTFGNSMEFDNRFIELLEDNTLIICGNSITFSPDVEEETLLNKNIHFAAGNTIKCSKKIKSVIQTKSTLARKLSIYDEK